MAAGSQAGMGLDRWLGVLHLDCRQQEERGRPWAWLEHSYLKAPPPVTRFLQEGHTHSSKTTPPNHDTPYEPRGPIFIQTDTSLLQKALRSVG